MKIKTLEDTNIKYIEPQNINNNCKNIFFFALSAEYSLNKHPINTPAKLFYEKGHRVFSVSLPLHEELEHEKALSKWGDKLDNEKNILNDFLQYLNKDIEIIKNKFQVDKFILCGLSRGSYIAAKIAINNPKIIEKILMFAPLTDISILNKNHHDSLSLLKDVDILSEIKTKMYIGNNDVRVGTRNAFNLLEAVCNTKKYPPDWELQIYKSVGFHGHGTPEDIFLDGVNWSLLE